VGPDGAYYVSELTGVPFAGGAAQVMRVVPGEPPQVYLSGFKTLIDLAFSPDGSLYVLQHATGAMFFGGPGQVIRIAPNGTRSVIVEGLTRPSSIAIGSDGAIYVSNFGTSVGGGEVLRITL
jgi:glucose/arabinose dehydrogenase